MKISSYKELEAYKKAYKLVLLIYKLTQKYPADEKYGLVSQIRRASISVPANIAEGYVRGSREYVQFLKIALGSAAEIETMLCLSQDLGYCAGVDFKEAYQLDVEVVKLLTYYIKKLDKG